MAPRVDLVIFGASGDLAQRKILPSLKRLASPDGMELRIIGAGRGAQSTTRFRDTVKKRSGSQRLAATAEWARVDYKSQTTFAGLKKLVAGAAHVIFYMATPPETAGDIIRSLGQSKLTTKGDPTRRIVVEKPLGHDLESARKLNAQLAKTFEEQQTFRIDHYLAKDTVQNVLAFRFSNSLFEPNWDRTMIHSIQITAAEAGDIGTRAGYYDHSGAVRDMLQNHVLQVLALTVMDAPTTFDPVDIRKSKLEALRAVQPIDPAMAVRGQYEGYLDAPGVPRGSRRETYAAARLVIENWRWEGVPIFVRSGKALRRSVTEVVVRYRDAPHLRIGGRRQPGIPTLIVLRIQPDEGVLLRIGAKRPGTRFEMLPAGLKLEYKGLTKVPLPDAYENVLLEVLAGGHTMFPGGREIERSWEIVDPLIQAWEGSGHPESYARGSWGPGAADELVSQHGGGRWVASGDEPGTQ